MKPYTIIIAILAIFCLGMGLYAVTFRPFIPDTNITIFFISSLVGFTFITIFLILSRREEKPKAKLKCNSKPELSNIKVIDYGDEKWLLDGKEIIHL